MIDLRSVETTIHFLVNGDPVSISTFQGVSSLEGVNYGGSFNGVAVLRDGELVISERFTTSAGEQIACGRDGEPVPAPVQDCLKFLRLF